jgi:hypothetical protein
MTYGVFLTVFSLRTYLAVCSSEIVCIFIHA